MAALLAREGREPPQHPVGAGARARRADEPRRRAARLRGVRARAQDARRPRPVDRGPRGLVRLAAGHVGVVYLLDGADRLLARPGGQRGREGRRARAASRPRGSRARCSHRREPRHARGRLRGNPAVPRPRRSRGFRSAGSWRSPSRSGEEAAGALLVGGTEPLSATRDELVRDARAAARRRPPERLDARPAAREERDARRSGRDVEARQQGEDRVPRVDEPRAAHASQRDPGLRGPPHDVAEGEPEPSRPRVAGAHQAQRRAPPVAHQRRPRPRQGRGWAPRHAPGARQPGAARAGMPRRGRQPARRQRGAGSIADVPEAPVEL